MTLTIVQPELVDGTCYESPSLREIRAGNCDELGNKILKLYWLGEDYAIYRTIDGVFVHFADCPARAKEQRTLFMEIAPELCELRFLTVDMRRAPGFARRLVKRLFSPQQSDEPFEELIYDHNIAQSLMLLMENNKNDARSVAKAALDMAVIRSTNDNTIKYVKSAMTAGLVLAAAFCAILIALALNPVGDVNLYVMAALYGILGSAFSIMVRVSSFEMKPCQQSLMNYWMARLRISLGLVGGFAIYLIFKHPIAAGVVAPHVVDDWRGAALIGFLGGFAERLAPTVFRNAAETMQGSSGTPVQEARRRMDKTQ